MSKRKLDPLPFTLVGMTEDELYEELEEDVYANIPSDTESIAPEICGEGSDTEEIIETQEQVVNNL